MYTSTSLNIPSGSHIPTTSTSYQLLFDQLLSTIHWYREADITVIAKLIMNVAFKRNMRIDSKESAALFIQEVEHDTLEASTKAHLHWGYYLMGNNWSHTDVTNQTAVWEGQSVGLQNTRYR